jgi:hypothetical protein
MLIVYSLWGSRPMYTYGAIQNAKAAKEFFPGWSVRMYHNAAVPADVLETLRNLDVELVLVEPDGSYGMFWRFRALFENHDRVLVRDADSRFTWRDKKAVDEWIASGKKFHMIRDHDEHYKFPIMAGMFGVAGSLPVELLPAMKEFSMFHKYIADQIFLANVVWPLMQRDLFTTGMRETPWMRDSWDAKNHIGLGFDENEQPRTDHGTPGDPC